MVPPCLPDPLGAVCVGDLSCGTPQGVDIFVGTLQHRHHSPDGLVSWCHASPGAAVYYFLARIIIAWLVLWE